MESSLRGCRRNHSLPRPMVEQGTQKGPVLCHHRSFPRLTGGVVCGGEGEYRKE